MAVVYQTGQAPEEISLLAEIFAEDLMDENWESIRRAFTMHRRRSTRFPTPAHIIALLPECRVLPERVAIPQETGGKRTVGIGKRTVGIGKLVCEALKGNKNAKTALDEIINKAKRVPA